uniref:Uncharacterized protein n=1 Tax=uncultured Thiotrichaceae bacterium TaxID=298394 RepID=A0A6S6U2H1_9GAMM|nr:MAG: Unknown protein [uncultured Thiotrichaceae bacterium]
MRIGEVCLGENFTLTFILQEAEVNPDSAGYSSAVRMDVAKAYYGVTSQYLYCYRS